MTDREEFEKWDKENGPTVPFNLIVDLTMHGDCHAKADRDLTESLMEVVKHVRYECWQAATAAAEEACVARAAAELERTNLNPPQRTRVLAAIRNGDE